MNGKVLKDFQKTGCAIEKSLYLCSVNVIIKMMRYNENRDERPPACQDSLDSRFYFMVLTSIL